MESGEKVLTTSAEYLHTECPPISILLSHSPTFVLNSFSLSLPLYLPISLSIYLRRYLPHSISLSLYPISLHRVLLCASHQLTLPPISTSIFSRSSRFHNFHSFHYRLHTISIQARGETLAMLDAPWNRAPVDHCSRSRTPIKHRSSGSVIKINLKSTLSAFRLPFIKNGNNNFNR